MNLSAKTKILNLFRRVFLLRPLENQLVNLNKGKNIDNFFAKLVPNYYQYPKGSIREVTRQGINYHLDLSDLFDWHIYYGFLDQTRTLLYSHIDRGATIIDVGANMGETSFSFAKEVGTTGTVIGFEPDKNNFERLTRNFKLNNLPQLQIVNKGLGNEEGFFLIKENETEPGNAGSKRIIGQSSTESPDEWKIEVIKLDTYMAQTNLSKLDLIKMDIEGYEMNAIYGSIETIKKFRPKLFLELHDIKLVEQGYSGKELLELLQKLNYNVFHADDNTPIESNMINDGDHFDILCLPKTLNSEAS